MRNCHILNISLNLDFIPNLVAIDDKVIVKIGESEYEFTMQSVQYRHTSHEVEDWHNGTRHRIKGYDDFDITGWLIDKNAQELKIAKQDVRQKQQEFKEAQRKLSELMGNK